MSAPRTLTLVTLSLAACVADDGDPCAHRACDVADAACLDAVARTMACRIGVDEIEPDVRFITSDEFAAELEADFAERSPAYVDALTTYYRGESLFSLMPPEYVYEGGVREAVERTRAYYSDSSREITIITDNVGDDRDAEYAVLVHEMTHAYQDARWDLSAFRDTHATTFDRYLGVRALVEGEAEYREVLAEIELEGIDPDRVDWEGYTEDFRANARELGRETSTPSRAAPSLFPYAYGVTRVVEEVERDGLAVIDDLFADPPESARQVIAGWPDDNGNLDAMLTPVAVPVLAAPYRFIGGGHQSIWLFDAMLDRTYASPAGPLSTMAVGADYLAVFCNEEDGTLVGTWRLRQDGAAITPRDVATGSETWTDMVGTGATHVVTTVEGDLLFVATSGPPAETILGAIEGWQHPDDADALLAELAGE